MAENTGYDGKEDKVSNLIHDTVVSLQKKVRCEKAANIQKAVAACINIFLADLAKEEPMFKHAELIQVGSYAEGTKILEPDEFDLLVVIDELSRPGAVAIDNDPEKVQGYTHLPEMHRCIIIRDVVDDIGHKQCIFLSIQDCIKCSQILAK